MTNSVLTSPSFYLLFLIRLLLMVVMATFLAHWKVVPLNFFCKSSIGCQVLFCHFQTLLYTRETDDRLISMVGGVNGVMNFLSRCSKVLSSTVKIDHLAHVRYVSQKSASYLSAQTSWWLAARHDPLPLPHGGHLLPLGLDRGRHQLRLLLHSSPRLGSQPHYVVSFFSENYLTEVWKAILV